MDREDHYGSAIENRNVEAVFRRFNKELDDFVQECDRILREWKRLPKSDLQNDKELRIRYTRAWRNFVRHIPFPVEREYIDGSTQVRMSEILPKGKKIELSNSRIPKMLEYIVRYVAFILVSQSPQYARREMIIFASLRFICESMDLTTMHIKPSDVLALADDVCKEMEQGTFERPRATYYEGHLFENETLTSSRKTAIYRGKRLRKYLENYIQDYRDLNENQLPTKDEIRKHLIRQCALSGDERLKVFEHKMSDKTLNKLITKGGYEDFVSKKRYPSSKALQPICESEPKMTLREVYQYLKEGFERLNQKSNKNNETEIL